MERLTDEQNAKIEALADSGKVTLPEGWENMSLRQLAVHKQSTCPTTVDPFLWGCAVDRLINRAMGL